MAPSTGRTISGNDSVVFRACFSHTRRHRRFGMAVHVHHGHVCTSHCAFSAIPERREARTRGGGTLWRRINAHYEQSSRFLVIISSLAIFHVLNFGVSWALVALQGRANHQLLVVAGLYSFLGAIGLSLIHI